ncbi:hypothetical protein PLICRDRAFT_436694 [Plicaturopsis crispa FD-325 SS-3]|uniref:FAD/NAD(P)-binding domain-containing protein n=1 Tax=Plicaturopsis crispa FD-325 SS-3 TaxID=944288 RepID=A0A0C9SQS3_PLICR|nr:hypothetical protein PLICRDRAFT_436694 [Plicaturopsis crispa FD-325 SS-3]
MPNPDVQAIVSAWISNFAAAVSAGDAEAVAATFLPEGWLRDVLVFTWDARSLEGYDKILAYLSEHLRGAHITDIKLDDRPHLAPEFSPAGPKTPASIGSAFTFDAPRFRGRGSVRLVATENGEWRALTVLLMMDDIKGHEEAGPESGVYGDHTLAWEDVWAERRAKIEADPQVIILGGGQTGLNVAARFKQMNIPSLVLDQNDRIGDNWRHRYPTLSLHTIRTHHSFLYQPYPANWPMYTPRDKLADWLEQYVRSQDLVVWSNSTILPTPKYDPATKKWTVLVRRNGRNVLLHPAHIVIAVGTLGAPRIPPIQSLDAFAGPVLHASKYTGANPYIGKRVIVVGAGNTAADICQDLSNRGASSVTLVQRTSTCVVTLKWLRDFQSAVYPEGLDQDIADFKNAGMPAGLFLKTLRAQEAESWESERELYDALTKAGVKLNMGIDGGGQPSLILERFGGFWIDVGICKLVISGKVKVKQGAVITSCTPRSVIFSDGSELEADALIFGTGYHSSRDSLKNTFGAEVIDRTTEMWGLDAEGEYKTYRPSGQPGLWYASGDFTMSRFISKQLALQLKAIELGMIPVPNIDVYEER